MWVAEWSEVVFTDESRICLQHHDGRIRVWRHRGKRMMNSCATLVLHRVLWYGSILDITLALFYCACIASALNSQHYISEVLDKIVLPYLQGLVTAIVQQGSVRPHEVRIVRRFFVNHQIELFPWPARSLDLSPIENMRPMIAPRLTQKTPLAVTSDQLWQHVEAASSAVPQEHIQSLFESIPRCVAAVISSNGIYSG
ncbi:transposable element Tcb1 transposase [Trichonephila clavipes]|nr:transposable element Tcb1 transposase [Trichonephila clavipes]